MKRQPKLYLLTNTKFITNIQILRLIDWCGRNDREFVVDQEQNCYYKDRKSGDYAIMALSDRQRQTNGGFKLLWFGVFMLRGDLACGLVDKAIDTPSDFKD